MPDQSQPEAAALTDSLAVGRRVGLSPESEKLADAVRRASGRFRGQVGHHVTLVTADVAYLNGGGSGVLALPAAPVAGLTILVDGTPLAEYTDYTVDRAIGLVRLKRGRVFPDELGNIRVTYTHGFPDNAVPQDIQDVVGELAEMILNAEAGIQSRSVLGDSTAYGAATVGSTQAWTRTVSKYGRG